MPSKYHQAADRWWLNYAKEMIQRIRLSDQEAVEEFSELSGEEGTAKFNASSVAALAEADDSAVLALLNDETSPLCRGAVNLMPMLAYKN